MTDRKAALEARAACPFCGSTKLHEDAVPNTGGNRRFVWCAECSAHGPWSCKPRSASEMWSSRAALMGTHGAALEALDKLPRAISYQSQVTPHIEELLATIRAALSEAPDAAEREECARGLERYVPPDVVGVETEGLPAILLKAARLLRSAAPSPAAEPALLYQAELPDKIGMWLDERGNYYRLAAAPTSPTDGGGGEMSDYECVCEAFEADETWAWTSVTMVKARKEHRCSECGETIKVGEMHEKFAGRAAGEFYSFRTCAFCASEIERLARQGDNVPRPGGFLACWLVAELRGELP